MPSQIGAFVTLTDRNDPVVLQNIRSNCRLNSVHDSTRVQPLTWGIFDKWALGLCHSTAPEVLVSPSSDMPLKGHANVQQQS